MQERMSEDMPDNSCQKKMPDRMSCWGSPQVVGPRLILAGGIYCVFRHLGWGGWGWGGLITNVSLAPLCDFHLHFLSRCMIFTCTSCYSAWSSTCTSCYAAHPLHVTCNTLLLLRCLIVLLRCMIFNLQLIKKQQRQASFWKEPRSNLVGGMR